MLWLRGKGGGEESEGPLSPLTRSSSGGAIPSKRLTNSQDNLRMFLQCFVGPFKLQDRRPLSF